MTNKKIMLLAVVGVVMSGVITVLILVLVSSKEAIDSQPTSSSAKTTPKAAPSKTEPVAEDAALSVPVWGITVNFKGSRTSDVMLAEKDTYEVGVVESFAITTKRMSEIESTFMPEGFMIGFGSLCRSKNRQTLIDYVKIDNEVKGVVSGPGGYFYALVRSEDFIRLTAADFNSDESIAPSLAQSDEMRRIGEDIIKFNESGSVEVL